MRLSLEINFPCALLLSQNPTVAGIIKNSVKSKIHTDQDKDKLLHFPFTLGSRMQSGAKAASAELSF